MDAPVISVLAYTLWPLLTLAMIALWIAAMVEISVHPGRRAFTSIGLVCIAAAVSVAAIIAVVGIGAVFAGQRSEATPGASSGWVQSAEQGGELPRRTYLFSFGLEHVSDVPSARPTSAKQKDRSSRSSTLLVSNS